MSPPRFQSIFFARGNLLPNGNQDHSGPQVPPHLEKPFQVAVTLLYLSTAIAQRPALKCLVPTSLRAAARSTFLTLRSMTPRLKTCYRTTIKSPTRNEMLLDAAHSHPCPMWVLAQSCPRPWSGKSHHSVHCPEDPAALPHLEGASHAEWPTAKCWRQEWNYSQRTALQTLMNT